MPVVDVVEERAFTASRVDRQHCPDQINFPPFLPCSSDPVWPLRRPIPLWAPFARARVSAVRSFSPTAGNFAVRPAVRVRPRDRQSTVFRTRPRRSSSASARAPRNSTGGRRARRRCLPGTPTSRRRAVATMGTAERRRRKGSAMMADGWPMLSYPVEKYLALLAIVRGRPFSSILHES